MKPFATSNFLFVLIMACLLTVAGCVGSGEGNDAVTGSASASEAVTIPDTTTEDITAITTVEEITVADTTAEETPVSETTNSDITVSEMGEVFVTDPLETVCSHSYEITAIAATCTEDGKKVITCSRCDYTETKSIKALGHDYKTTTVKATCERDGRKTKVCSRCSDKRVEAIPATGHIYTYTVKVAPTATVEGILTYTCSACHGTYERNLGTLGFDASKDGNCTRISTSNNPNNYIDFRISGDTLTIYGRIVREGLNTLWLFCGDGKSFGPNSKTINVASGELFVVELSLAEVTEPTDVAVCTRVDGEKLFWSYIWGEITVIPIEDRYVFRSSLVLSHNLEMMGKRIDPSECLSLTIPDPIRRLSNEIVGNETDTYQKLFLLHKWVVENIYYDYDYSNGKTDQIALLAMDVYNTRRTICDGYANLLGYLIQAQEIPCICLRTYSVKTDSIGRFDENNYKTTESNHVHVEAYLAEDRRWVTMDPTWDSANQYENGEYITKTAKVKWFDISVDLMSFTHKIQERPYPFYQ